MKIVCGVAAAALYLSACAASAATYTFNFADNGNTGWQSTFSVGSDEVPSVEVDVTAATYSGDKKTIHYDDSRAATWQGFGLGVCGDWSTYRDKCKDENHRIDGMDNNDLAIFTLDSALALHSIKFGSFNPYTKVEWEWTCVLRGRHGGCWDWDAEKVTTTFYDSFDLFIDLGGGLSYQLSDLVAGMVTFDDLLVSDVFGIGASGKYDAFKIKEIVFKDAPPNVIPLPAAGWLLVAGLGGLAAMRRKKTAA
ncbi:VPLPA-CTERM sorting domain-containing protein [Palleronia sp. KMU-117]|uniref:VPLPA-CTERM sorting domain-containing protein n=1 Tax=Palleronia sp. KMU-117 TaxID=3434108 RepID=UPI003D74D1C6